MDLEAIMLHERSQTAKDKKHVHIFSNYIWNLRKIIIMTLNRNRLMDTENKLVFTRGKREVKKGKTGNRD